MKALTHKALSALAAILCAAAAFAQDAPAPPRFAPEGEGFSVQMPGQPSSSPEQVAAGELKLAGRRYEAADENGRRYVVWSLKDPADVGRRLVSANYVSELFRGEGLYLDLVAQVAWELIAEPENEKAWWRITHGYFQLVYGREFRLDGKPAREYTLASKKKTGPVYVCADGPRVYVVAAIGANQREPQLKQFVESFSLKPDAPASTPSRAQVSDPKLPGGTGGGVGPGKGGYDPGMGADRGSEEARGVGDGSVGGWGGAETGAPVDYNRTFRMREVTQKARVTSKPEPGFTEEARKFGVTGVVRIRAVMSKTSEVTNVSVIKGLPHGLTAKAIRAVRQVKFQPAQKDGRPVSQYITFEYNFYIY